MKFLKIKLQTDKILCVLIERKMSHNKIIAFVALILPVCMIS
jgi:hypothetical protein